MAHGSKVLLSEDLETIYALANMPCICEILNIYEDWAMGRVEVPRCDPCAVRNMTEYARAAGRDDGFVGESR